MTSLESAIAKKLAKKEAIANGTVKKPKPRARKREVIHAELQELWAAGKVSEIRAIHLVEMYALCHSRLYGIDAGELDSDTERVRAIAAAKRMVEREFHNDMQRAIDFLKWSWARESERVRWAKSTGKDRNRMAWTWQFAPRHVVDYRVAMLSGAKPSSPPPAPPPPGGNERQTKAP